jgi:predicted metal-dependent phosphoesterase TrpH
MKLDLHVHTTFSDGDMTPRQVAALAMKAGLDGVAITDHDECRGLGELEPVPGLMLIPGIEIAASGAGAEVHVLGLGIDWRHEAMTDYARRATNSRRRRAQVIVDKLRAGGYDFGMEDVDRECQGCAVGRPHIALALVRKGFAESVDDAFARFISRQAPFYVPLEKITVAHAAALIREAGGRPVIAHPGLLRPGVWDALAPTLKETGVWGLEAYHPAHSDGQCRIFASEARRLGLFVTAGSDFHGALGQGAALGGEKRGGAYLQMSFKDLVQGLRQGS